MGLTTHINTISPCRNCDSCVTLSGPLRLCSGPQWLFSGPSGPQWPSKWPAVASLSVAVFLAHGKNVTGNPIGWQVLFKICCTFYLFFYWRPDVARVGSVALPAWPVAFLQWPAVAFYVAKYRGRISIEPAQKKFSRAVSHIRNPPICRKCPCAVVQSFGIWCSIAAQR